MNKKNLPKIIEGASQRSLFGLLPNCLIVQSASSLLAFLFLFIAPSSIQAQTLSLISNPAGTTGYGVSSSSQMNPITFNGKVYFSFFKPDNTYQLAEWNGTILSLIASPTGTNLYRDIPPIVWNGNLYLCYVNASNRQHLAKFDGNTLSLIDNANASDLGYQGLPIVFNNELYIKYLNTNNKNLLAKYNGTSTSLSYIANADPNDVGYINSPIIMNNVLYMRYLNTNNKNVLAKYNGSALDFISNANASDEGYVGFPIIFNNELYIRYLNANFKDQLAKYSGIGSSLSYIANVDPNDIGHNGFPIVTNSALYIRYRNASNKDQLAKYDGTTLSLIANLNVSDAGYEDNPIVFNNELYIRYLNASNKSQLAKYSGSGTTLITIDNANASDGGYSGTVPIILNNALYIRYRNASNKTQLAKYNGTGTTLSYIANPNSNDAGYQDLPFILNNALYIRYRNASNKFQLAKFDGTNISAYNNPDAGLGYLDLPIVNNGQILVRYANTSSTYQIAYLNTCATTYATLNVSICAGSSYNFNGIAQSTAGTYYDTLVNAGGCDSIITLNLSIKATSVSATNLSICPSELPYTWNGLLFTSGGSQTAHFTNSIGCDSAATLILTIKPTSTSISNLTICSHELPYSWNGLSFTAAGTQTAHLTNSVGCDSAATLNLSVTPSTIISTTNITACGSFTWNGNTYTQSGTYISPLSGCDIHVLNLTITHELLLSAKVFLLGAYDSIAGKMHDSLRVKGLIPTMEPYSAAPFNKAVISELAGETVSSSVLAITGDNAIIDWVFVELRSASNPATIVATKRALVQRDGDIVSAVDGISPVPFFTMPNDDYYISIKHRNHLGIQTQNTINMVSCIPTVFDFTSSLNVYTIPSQPANSNYASQKLIGSTYLMWSGDARYNKNVKYNGLNNDKDFVLTSLGGVGFINTTLNQVYRSEDINMDGKVRYNNTDNDRVVILNNLGVGTPNNVINQHTSN